MNREIDEQLKKYISEHQNDKDFNIDKVLQEFIKKYNSKELEQLEKTSLDFAYEKLEEAYKAKSITKAKKLTIEAYNIDNRCVDAGICLAELEETEREQEAKLLEVLGSEKEYLTKENYFKKDNIGSFYQIFETRPYIRGLYTLCSFYRKSGKIKAAKEVCEEILRLNKTDNTGARYILMQIYAYFEDETNLLKQYKKYNENSLLTLLPLLILYFKKSNYEKATEYLIKIDKYNPNFVKYIKDEKIKSDIKMDGYYSYGDVSEVEVVLSEYSFILVNMLSFFEFIATTKLK